MTIRFRNDYALEGTHSVHRGWLGLDLATLRLPDGTRAQRHVVVQGQSTSVLPYDPVRKTALLVSQPRAAVLANGDPPILEAIAGGVDSDGTAEAARREALEEGGVRLGRLEPLMNVYGLPAYSRERSQLFLAEYHDNDRVSFGGGHHADGEFIEVFELPLSDLLQRLDAGEIICSKTLVLILTLQRRRPDLFR